MNKIFITSAIVVLFLLCLLYDAKRGRSRKARLDAISTAPLPQLPLSFQWNWWGIAIFMAIPVVILAVSVLVVVSVGMPMQIAVPGLLASVAAAYYVYGYLRFALKGPSFILKADGIEFAGHYLRWRDVSAIDYFPAGRTPRIRFQSSDSQAAGFSIFDQFYGKTSVSACFVSDPDSLVGWARRFREEDSRTSSATPVQ
jgi:hypothetical protein